MTLKKLGGIAALIEAATYIFGFALLTTVLAEAGLGEDGQLDQLLAFMVANQGLTLFWMFSAYVLSGVILLIFVLVFHDLVKRRKIDITLLATIFGCVWAGFIMIHGMDAIWALSEIATEPDASITSAQAMWLVISSVQDGLGGGNEIVGGLWILLISLAALNAEKLSKPLNWLGITIGIAGVVSTLPPLGEIGGAVFGLGFIFWFLWTGVTLLRGKAA